jgi:hypothetical protein
LLAAWTLLVVSCTYIYDKVGRVDFARVHVNPSVLVKLDNASLVPPASLLMFGNRPTAWHAR